MLNLRAGFASKLNCEYSIFVTFTYNPNYVNLMKSIKNRAWNNDTKEWEIGWDCYNQLIGTLNQYGIPYNGQQFMQSIEELKQIVQKMQTIQKQDAHVDASILNNVEFKTQPFSYQKEGIAYGLTHDKFLLSDSPGLGKSLQATNIARLKRGGKHCLIIVGYKSLLFNWVNEIQIHSNEKAYVLGQRVQKKTGKLKTGTISDRLEDLQNLDKIEEFFVITDITTLRQCEKQEYINKKGKKAYNKSFVFAELIDKWCREGQIGRIILDESHTCCDSNTLISTIKGDIPICNIKIGDKIKSYNKYTSNIEYKEVINTFRSEVKVTFLTLTLMKQNGEKIKLKVTPSHKILTKNRGYVCACDLNIKDEIIYG